MAIKTFKRKRSNLIIVLTVGRLQNKPPKGSLKRRPLLHLICYKVIQTLLCMNILQQNLVLLDHYCEKKQRNTNHLNTDGKNVPILLLRRTTKPSIVNFIIIEAFRVNLLEEEIRKDLEQLRTLQTSETLMSKKKVKKNTIELSPVKLQKPSPSSHEGKEPLQTKKVVAVQEYFQTPPKQTVEVVAPPIIAAPINRPRRNTKVNYRSMVGEP